MKIENIVKEIDILFQELKKHMLRGLAGSKLAQKKARVATVALEKKMKEYRAETMRGKKEGKG